MTYSIPHRLLAFAAAFFIVVAMIAVVPASNNPAFAAPDLEEKLDHNMSDHAAELGDDYHVSGHHEGDTHGYGEDHAGDHGDGGLPQFDPSSFTSQLFWLFFFFAILYMIFSKKTLPEISSVLENRKEHIESYTEEAEKLRIKAEQTQRIYEEGLEAARKEAAQITYDLHEEIQEKAAHKNEFFLEQAKHEITELDKKLEKAKKETITDISAIAAEVASAAAEKIVGISTDIDTAREVVDTLSNKKDSKKKAA